MSITLSEAKEAMKILLAQPQSSIVPGLVGLSGIGKTWIIKEAAQDFDYELVSFNASQLQEGDLALPVKTENDEVEYKLNHKLKDVMAHPDIKHLIFFDEFNRATNAVRNELMTMLNESTVYGYVLPENTRFAIAMNPTASMEGYETSDFAVEDMDDAHYNRFVLISIDVSVSAWLEWGKAILHPAVVQFFSDIVNQQKYFYGKDEGGVSIATPRTWHNVSNLLNFMEETQQPIDTPTFHEIVAGQVGRQKGDFFLRWMIENVHSLTPAQLLAEDFESSGHLDAFRLMGQAQQMSLVSQVMASLGNQSDERIAINMLLIYRALKGNDERFNMIHLLITKADALFDRLEEKDADFRATAAEVVKAAAGI